MSIPDGQLRPTNDSRGAVPERTLDALDPPAWPSAPVDATPLQRRVHALRQIPVSRLDAEDLRVLVRQGVALPAVVPAALEMLQAKPLVSGDMYPGDLLKAVVTVPAEHWSQRSDRRAVLAVLDRLDPHDPEYPYLEGDELRRAAEQLRQALGEWRERR